MSISVNGINEGPQLLLRCERMQCLAGQTFESINCPELSISDLEMLIGQVIDDVSVVGKEMFIRFVDVTSFVLRIHYGLDGIERILSRNAVFQPHSNPKRVLSATIYCSTNKLEVWDTSLSIRKMSYYHEWQSRRLRDIMNPQFDFQNALNALLHEKGIISDILLNQQLFPGIGNEMKSEGLFLSHIHPNAVIADLTKEQLLEMFKQFHQFAAEWYQLNKVGKHIRCLIYYQNTCGRCKRESCLIRHGQRQRITYYCKSCQNLGCPQSDLSSSSNSVINELEAIAEDRTDLPYLCQPLCMCRSPAFLNRSRKLGINMNRLFWSCPKGMTNPKRCNFFHWADSQFPKCDHQRPSILRRVLKAGPNNGRYFFCCGGDMNSQCKFFEWSDVTTSATASSTVTKTDNSDSTAITRPTPVKRLRLSLDISIPL